MTLRAIVLAVLLVPQEAGPRAPIRKTIECTAPRVIDGDTIECSGIGRARLIGIDAPELSQRPFGDASERALRAQLKSAKRVELETDVETHDKYGRLLAYVWADRRLINWSMARAGWVVLLTIAPNVQYANELRAAEQRAHVEDLGLWHVKGFACTPADRRERKC